MVRKELFKKTRRKPEKPKGGRLSRRGLQTKFLSQPSNQRPSAWEAHMATGGLNIFC